MSRPATSRLKCNPPLGRMPVLQFLRPCELQIDPAYQRSLETSTSQTLVRRIAQFWNWDLCQPLVVARRGAGGLYVIDGQHRLAAANLRGDIGQLPGVVVEYTNAADEAASFVHLNQQRRPLTKLDLFKAAVASEDGEAKAILHAIEAAGLSVAPHSNHTAWKPGMISNIGGVENAWRAHGSAPTREALGTLAEAFAGQVLRYAGTIFPGVVAVAADEMQQRGFAERRAKLVALLGSRDQTKWRGAIMRARTDDPNLKFAQASAKVVREAWAMRLGVPAKSMVEAKTTAPVGQLPAMVAPGKFEFRPDRRGNGPDGDGLAWCDQCEMRVSKGEAEGCKSRWCTLRKLGPLVARQEAA